jgi:hypothetical protein
VDILNVDAITTAPSVRNVVRDEEDEGMRNVRKARRSLLSGLGIAAVGVAFGSRPLAAQTASGGRFSGQRAISRTGGWMQSLENIEPSSTPRHRRVRGEALLYANNLYEANKSGYTLPEADIVVVACMRHFATPFAYNDAIWKKYGKNFSTMIEFMDPKTKQAPSTNVLNSAAYGMALSNFGNTIDSVVKRGTRFAVCDMATHFFAMELATATKGNADAIYKELVANTIPNSHMVAAGVVAVNRRRSTGSRCWVRCSPKRFLRVSSSRAVSVSENRPGKPLKRRLCPTSTACFGWRCARTRPRGC